MISIAELEKLKAIAAASTKVNEWYANGGTVRGPFNRWFNVTDVPEQYKQHVAWCGDDAQFAAAAMNNMVKLIECIEDLRKQRDELELQLGIENMVIDGKEPGEI
jgi:hypothetical protein